MLCFWRLSEKLGNSRAYRDFRRDLNPHYRRSQRAGLQRATYKVHGLQAGYNVLHFWTPYHRDGGGLEAKTLACKSQLVSRKWITADTSLLRHQTWCDLAPNYRNASARCGVLKENEQLDGECRRPWGHGPSRCALACSLLRPHCCCFFSSEFYRGLLALNYKTLSVATRFTTSTYCGTQFEPLSVERRLSFLSLFISVMMMAWQCVESCPKTLYRIQKNLFC